MPTPFNPETPRGASVALSDQRDLLAMIYGELKSRRHPGDALTSENVFDPKAPHDLLDGTKPGTPIVFFKNGTEREARIKARSYVNEKRVYSWQTHTIELADVKIHIPGKPVVYLCQLPSMERVSDALNLYGFRLRPPVQRSGC